MATMKRQIGFRFSDTVIEILKCGKEQLGIPQTSILELAVRDWAQRNRIVTPCEASQADRTKETRGSYEVEPGT